MPERYGPYTTVYNRFNRWRKAGIWDKLMDAIVKAHDGEVQMIDSSIVRVHQHASGVKKRVAFVVSVEAGGGLTTKIHARAVAQISEWGYRAASVSRRLTLTAAAFESLGTSSPR